MAQFFFGEKEKPSEIKVVTPQNRKAMSYKKYIKDTGKELETTTSAPRIVKEATNYLRPLICKLQSRADKRFSYTLYDIFYGMLSHRDKTNSLLLSELGGYINGPQHAPAGTKRLSNLLACKEWSHQWIAKELLAKSKQRLSKKGEAGKRWLLHWDDSVLEKPESWRTEGLCSVRSSKGLRLTKIKPGYYHPPKHLSVPGYEWSACVLSSQKDSPTICQMRWWTKRGKHKEDPANIFYRMLAQTSEMIGQTAAEVWHVFDRGYANYRTLDYLIIHFQQQFIIRWKSNFLLENEQGVVAPTYRHSLGKKASSKRWVWDKERKEKRQVKILYMPVRCPDSELQHQQLYLVIARDAKQGRPPIYFLTDVPIDSNGMAWAILFSYMKRWDIEQVFRFGKTAMGMESPRLWFFDRTLKLLSLVTLVMDFILSMVAHHKSLARRIIDKWCPRTGNRQKKTFLPIYRLRLALARLILYEIFPIRLKG